MPYILQILFSGLIAFVPYGRDNNATAYRVLLINGRDPGKVSDNVNNQVSHIPAIRFKTKNLRSKNVNPENIFIHPGSAFPATYNDASSDLQGMWVLNYDDLDIAINGESIARNKGSAGTIAHTTDDFNFDLAHKMIDIYRSTGLQVNSKCFGDLDRESGLVSRLRIAKGRISIYQGNEYVPLKDIADENDTPYISDNSYKFLEINETIGTPSHTPHESRIYSCVSLIIDNIANDHRVEIKSDQLHDDKPKSIVLAPKTDGETVIVMIENAPPLGLRNENSMPGSRRRDLDYELIYKISNPRLLHPRVPSRDEVHPYPINCAFAVYNSDNKA